MESGKVYTKHIRGSKYHFDKNTIFYKYPNGQRCRCLNPDKQLIYRIGRIKGRFNGSFRINENREIITYRKIRGTNTWEPVYVGKLKEDLIFEDMCLNPLAKAIAPGLLWVGFCYKHGSRFSMRSNGEIFFRETVRDKYKRTKEEWTVIGLNKKHIDKIKEIKGSGVLKINEYGQIWIPVSDENLRYQMEKPEFNKMFMNQWNTLTNEVVNTIKNYKNGIYYDPNSEEEQYFNPIYIGKQEGELTLPGRDDRAHTLRKDEDDL
jgi:hypothetical protein